MKGKSQPQHRVAVFLDPPLYKRLKTEADKQGAALTQMIAQLVAKKFAYEPQMKPRKFKHAA